MKYYSAIEKEILSFTTTWMELVGIMLSEIIQKQILQDLIYYIQHIKKTKETEN